MRERERERGRERGGGEGVKGRKENIIFFFSFLLYSQALT